MKYRRAKQVVTWDSELECDVEAPVLTVHEEDDGVPTGILDADGIELYRYEKAPLGFIKTEE